MSVLEDPGSIPGTSTREGQLSNELALFVGWGRESWDSLPHLIALQLNCVTSDLPRYLSGNNYLQGFSFGSPSESVISIKELIEGESMGDHLACW